MLVDIKSCGFFFFVKLFTYFAANTGCVVAYNVISLTSDNVSCPGIQNVNCGLSCISVSEISSATDRKEQLPIQDFHTNSFKGGFNLILQFSENSSIFIFYKTENYDIPITLKTQKLNSIAIF